MTMYDYVWLCMTIYDYPGLCMTRYNYIWLNMTMYDYVWLCMTINDDIWLFMTLYDYVWIWMTMLDYEWLFITMYDYVWLMQLCTYFMLVSWTCLGLFRVVQNGSEWIKWLKAAEKELTIFKPCLRNLMHLYTHSTQRRFKIWSYKYIERDIEIMRISNWFFIFSRIKLISGELQILIFAWSNLIPGIPQIYPNNLKKSISWVFQILSFW